MYHSTLGVRAIKTKKKIPGSYRSTGLRVQIGQIEMINREQTPALAMSCLGSATSSQNGSKSPFSIPMIYTGGRRIPTTFGTNRGSRHGDLAPTLRAVAVQLHEFQHPTPGPSNHSKWLQECSKWLQEGLTFDSKVSRLSNVSTFGD